MLILPIILPGLLALAYLIAGALVQRADEMAARKMAARTEALKARQIATYQRDIANLERMAAISNEQAARWYRGVATVKARHMARLAA